MPGTLLWNLALTATAAVGLALLCRLGPLQRRPALRHWLWLLLIVKVVTPPLISLPMLPAERSDLPPAVMDSDTTLATRTEAAVVADFPAWVDAEGKRKSEWSEWSESSQVSRSGGPTEVAGVNVAGSDMIGTDRNETASGATNQAVAPTRTAAPSYSMIATAVSMLGTCVFLTLGTVRLVRLRRWIRRADNEDPALSEVCAELAARLGIRGGVEGRVVDTRITPFLWGWRRHRVVLPRKLVEELSRDRLRGIVAHELGHLVRRDHWVNLFVFFVKAAMWWNPVIWWAERELTAAQELCCDAIAVDLSGTDRRGYAATLLEAIEFIQHEPFMSYAPAPGMGSRRSILRRFEMIGEARLSHRLSWRAMLLLLAFVLPLLCIPVRAQEEKSGEKPAVAATETTDAKKKADPPSKDEKSKDAESKDAKEKPATPRRERVVGERPKGNCSIRGKLVSAETGEPIANGRMYLFYTVTHRAIFVNTAADGTFAFEDIPEGPFSLKLSLSPGWQDVSYNPEGRSRGFLPFSLKKGEQRSGIVLKAKPAYEIAGRVLDEKGNLPKDIKSLTVLGWYHPEGSKAYTNVQTRVDPKDGSYVLDGLNGKPVYVMAINWQAARKGTARPPIYYPGTFSRSDAKPVVFGEKRRVEGINIALRKEGGLVLEGTIVDESGKPVPEAFVVAHRPDMLFDFVTAYTDEKGRYRIDGLGEGAFLVHVDAVHRGFVRTRTPVELEEKNKTTTHDFTLNRGVEISGKLVDEEGKDWGIGRSHGWAYVLNDDGSGQLCGGFSLTDFRNKHRVMDISFGSGGSFSPGEGDYQNSQMLFPTISTFVIQGVKPGRTKITFSPQKEGREVVKILRDGKDVLKSGLETKPGEKIEGLEIVIGKPPVAAKESEKESQKEGDAGGAESQDEKVSGERPRGNCSISGKLVSAETGKPIENGQMYLFDNVNFGAIFVPTAADGTFVFKDIPKGPFSLKLSACPGYQDVEYNPDDKPAPLPPFTLKEGEHRSGIVLKAEPARAIAGKVRDEDGDIPENVKTLSVLGWVEKDDGKGYTGRQAVVNKQDGSYLLDGLGDKPVYVMAIDWQRAKKGIARPPVYYPSTFFRKDAKPITFDGKPRVDGVDITLKKEGGLVLEGTVVDEAGKPVPGAFVVAHRPEMRVDFVTAYTDDEGRYRIDGLGEGAFLVHVDAAYRGLVRTRTPVDLDGKSKKTERNFTLKRGVEISGKLVDEEGNDWDMSRSRCHGHADVKTPDEPGRGSGGFFSLTSFRNKFSPKNIRIGGSGGDFAQGEGEYVKNFMLFPTNSTFIMPGVKPGHTTISFSPREKGQEVVKILVDGKDVLKSGIETKPGEDLKDVRIVIGKESVDATKSEKTSEKEKKEEDKKDKETKSEENSPSSGKPADNAGTPKSEDETGHGERPRGNCSIRGKVVSAETGEPIANGTMYLSYHATFGAIFVRTAADGTFAFEDIPKGPFSLTLSNCSGYQRTPYNPAGEPASYPFPPFTLEEGEHRAGIVLKAKPACAVSGKVRDENGNVPENAKTLRVLGWFNKDGWKAYHLAKATVNPADGSYVLDGLGGDPVYVMAIDWRGAQEGNAHPPIYYPGTFSRKDAKLVTFDEKRRVDGIDIAIKKEGGLVLEGTVVDEAGKPVPEAFVVAYRPDMFSDFVTAYTDDQGRYRIHGLGEGAFQVNVDAAHRGLIGTRTPLDLDGQNEKTELNFTLNRGVEISGKFVDEEGADWEIGESHGDAHLQTRDEPATEYNRPFGLSSFCSKYGPKSVDPEYDGDVCMLGEGDYPARCMVFPTKSTFVIRGMKPGHTMLHFSPAKERQKVVKILVDGKDVLKSGIETKPGEDVKDVRVVIGKE